MPTVIVTFVQATYVLATFVHISIISAVTDPILSNLLGPNFFGAVIFVDQHIFWPEDFLDQNISLYPKFLSFLPKYSELCETIYSFRKETWTCLQEDLCYFYTLTFLRGLCTTLLIFILRTNNKVEIIYGPKNFGLELFGPKSFYQKCFGPNFLW